MLSFNSHSTLSEGVVNSHMTHLDELVLTSGTEGLRAAILYLKNVTDFLSGHTKAPVNVTVKWDGSPAIICGIDPDTGKFFVATKGVFAKTPKVNYTVDDIKKNHTGELADILAVALDNLSKLGIKGILQGDLLWVKGQLVDQTIDGEKYVTFRRNTITYAVPYSSPLAATIKSTNMGIVFHTAYSGTSLSDLTASFKVDVSSLRKTPAVWFKDASYSDVSGMATMTASETTKVRGYISEIGKLFSKLSSVFINKVASDPIMSVLVMTHNNSIIRAGGSLVSMNSAQMTRNLRVFVQAKYQKELESAKTKKSARLNTELGSLNTFMDAFEVQFGILFEIQRLMNLAKGEVVAVLERAKSAVSKFVLDNGGLKAVADEGFVAVDHIGNAVKLVDRMTFSRNNFLIAKQWDTK